MATTEPNIIWQPLPGSQQAFMYCPYFEALNGGTRGGGKTDTLLMTFAQFVGLGFGDFWRGIIFRLTYKQLEDVEAKSQRWFRQIFPKARYNASQHFWQWPTGEVLYLSYGATEADYWNYHGWELPFLAFEELTNWKDSGFYESMMSCCRSSCPDKRMPRMIRATTNPYGVGHSWVKERFRIGELKPGTVVKDDDGRERVYIHSTIYENKVLLDADPNYLKGLEGIKDPNRRKAWLLGDWDIHVGSFLEGVWDATRHVVKPFPIPSTWKVWRSMDWGYSAPYCVLWMAQDPDGCIYIWRELYGAGEKPPQGSKENAAAVAKKIKKIEEHDSRMGLEYRMNLADPAIFSKVGTDRTIGRIFRDAGVKWQEAWNAKGSRVNGAQAIIQLLAEDKLKVFSTCKHWLRTVPSLPPDETNPEDVDTDMEDHAWDATRYGIMRRRRNPDAPHDEEEVTEMVTDDKGNQWIRV